MGAPAKRVGLLQGNATVARLMKESLEEEAFAVEILRGSPPGAPRTHLVIVDVDSGLTEAQRWLRYCDERHLPVVICGVERSREQYLNRPWLGRPFSAGQLRSICRELLWPAHLEDSGKDTIPPAIQVGNPLRKAPTLELSVHSSDPDEESNFEEAEPNDLMEVFDVNASGSMILEIEDLHHRESAGGVLVGRGVRRSFTEEELMGTNPFAEVPDTDIDLGTEASTGAVQISLASRNNTDAAPSSRADVTTISSLSDVVGGDFSSVCRVSSLVAEHWDQLGLTARTSDRADRLQRILTAMWREGMEGVVEELRRIPSVHGFSGRLETLRLVDLLQTIRDRRLRGRLEIGERGRSFVIYLDGDRLVEIESLTENTGGVLLSVLLERGEISFSTYTEYRSQPEGMELQLRQEGLISALALREARAERARRLVRSLCDSHEGTFAFIEVPQHSHQAWPTLSLELGVDELLLEILPKESLNVPENDDSPPNSLLFARERVAYVSDDSRTNPEREALQFVEQGGRIEPARQTLESPEEPNEEDDDHLRRLELLRKLGRDEVDAADRAGSAVDALKRPTRVGSLWEGSTHQPRTAGQAEETQRKVSFSVGVSEESEGWEQDIDAVVSVNPGNDSDE